MKKVFPGASPGIDIFAQKSPVEGKEKRDASRLSQKLFRQKPQILSIPGISPKELHRYRVILGSEVLGDRLTMDEALLLAKGGAK
jgi:hypothetical protein